MKNTLQNYLNESGKVTGWPAKYSNQKLVLIYLAEKFAPDTTYTERQVNDVLKEWHTFEDWAVLRRGLVDEGLMQRDSNGTAYVRLRP